MGWLLPYYKRDKRTGDASISPQTNWVDTSLSKGHIVACGSNKERRANPDPIFDSVGIDMVNARSPEGILAFAYGEYKQD